MLLAFTHLYPILPPHVQLLRTPINHNIMMFHDFQNKLGITCQILGIVGYQIEAFKEFSILQVFAQT